MGRAIFLGLVAALAVAPPAQAKSRGNPIVLEPSSPWNIDYGEEKCSLIRVFGEGDDAHMLAFRQAAPSETFELTAAGPKLSSFRTFDGTRVQFGPGFEEQETYTFAGDIDRFGPAVIGSNMRLFHEEVDPEQGRAELAAGGQREDGATIPLPSVDISLAQNAEFVSFKQRRRQVVFNTGSLAKPLAALNSCTQNRVSHWGLDLDRHRNVIRFPAWKNADKVVKAIQLSYPKNALRAGESAIIRLRVLIDERGVITECVLNNATVAESLKSPACEEMKKAVFEPALDSAGNPMKSYYATNVIYRIN